MLYHIPLRQKIITMLAVMTGLFLVALDQTIVSTALSAIVEEFNSFSSLSWVVTAYLLGSTVTVPIAGKLSDLFGRRLMLLIGVAVFVITSLFSGSAETIEQLIIARGFQGVGGGIIMANAFTIVGDLFSPRERGRWQGFIGAAFAIASVAGPLLGGYLTDAHMIFGFETNWRWNFWMNVPIGLAAFLLIARFSPKIKHDHKPIVDYLGAGALALALSSIILAVDNTEKIFEGLINSGMNLSLLKATLFAIAGIATALFVWFETKAQEPIIPLSFFKNRTYTSIMIIATLFGAAFLGAIIYLTQFNMQVYGVSATAAGLMLLPMVGTVTIVSAATGVLVTKTGKYKTFFISGMSIAAVSVLLLTTLNVDSGYLHEALIMAAVGFGMGTSMPIMNLAVQNEFEQRDLGAATASSQLFRGLGSTIGLAIFGAMLTTGLDANLQGINDTAYVQQLKQQPQTAALIGDGSSDTIVNLNTEDSKDKIRQAFNAQIEQSELSEQKQKAAKQDFAQQQDDFSRVASTAFADSLRPLFIVSAILMASAAAVGAGVKERKLRGGVEETPGAAEPSS